MDISKLLPSTSLSPSQKEILVKKLSQHITLHRWNLMQKVIQYRTHYISLILEDIYQAHNAAAVVRSCDAFGIHNIHIIENRNKLRLDNTTVAKGADKWLNFNYYNDPKVNNTQACIHHLKSQGYRIGATTLGKNSISLEEIPLDKPIAIMIGSEKNGLSEEACSLSDFCIELPMYGFTQSFNLSVCAAIVLHHLTTKLRNSTIPWELLPQEKQEILLLWLQRCVPHWETFIES